MKQNSMPCCFVSVHGNAGTVYDLAKLEIYIITGVKVNGLRPIWEANKICDLFINHSQTTYKSYPCNKEFMVGLVYTNPIGIYFEMVWKHAMTHKYKTYCTVSIL